MKTVDWRYYRLKKAFRIFPVNPGPRAAAPYICAGFLEPYYAAIEAKRGAARRLFDRLVAFGFRLWLPGRARKVAARYGLDADWARRAVRIGRARFADPKDMVLYRIEKPEDLDDVLRHFEHAPISKIVNPLNWKPNCVLKDKTAFAARCAAAGLRIPQTYATCVDGRLSVAATPPPGEICVKPTNGRSGVGVEIHAPAPGDLESAAAFGAALGAAFGRKVDWIAQERLRNHPDIAEIALDAVATCRVATMKNEAGAPEIVTQALRFAQIPGNVVDNLKAGGLMAPLDAETGRLGLGCVGRAAGDFATHPANGARIEGRVLPFFQEAKALALTAHETAFAEYNLIGWDIAITADGPVLIEGNGQPSMIIAQRSARRGVGETRFGELILHHLRMAGALAR